MPGCKDLLASLTDSLVPASLAGAPSEVFVLTLKLLAARGPPSVSLTWRFAPLDHPRLRGETLELLNDNNPRP